MTPFPAVVPHLWLPGVHLARPPWKFTLWNSGRAEVFYGCWLASRLELGVYLLLRAMEHRECSSVSPELLAVKFQLVADVGEAWFEYDAEEWLYVESGAGWVY